MGARRGRAVDRGIEQLGLGNSDVGITERIMSTLNCFDDPFDDHTMILCNHELTPRHVYTTPPS